jgi:hypothetical protein
LRTSLPVKAIASLGFCLLLVILLTGVSMVLAMAKIGRELVDPVAMAQSVKSIGFAGTPDGYTVTKALAAPGVELVLLERKSDLQVVYLLRLDRSPDGDDLEDGRTLENITTCIFARDGQKLSLSDVREKGKIEIKPGGAKLQYQMGSLTDPKSTVYSGMVGFVRMAKKLLIVEAVKPGANTFDKASVLELLQQMDGL